MTETVTPMAPLASMAPQASPKTEAGSFEVEAVVRLGTPSDIYIRRSPDDVFRAREVQMNAPCAGLISIEALKVGNISILCPFDTAFDASKFAVKTEIDVPTITPANAAILIGSYSGKVPEGMKADDEWKFVVRFDGVKVAYEEFTEEDKGKSIESFAGKGAP